MNNCQIAIREVSHDVGISIGSCQEIFSSLQNLLNFEQKQWLMEVPQESLNEVNSTKLQKHDIIDDETRVYGYDIETKAQSSHCVCSVFTKTKKTQILQSNVKIMLAMFNFKGIVHLQFLPQTQTINKEFYLQNQCLCMKKCPYLW